MQDNADDLKALDDLIEALDAAERGSRALDIRIEYCLGVALGGRVDIAGTLIEEGISWDTVKETLDSRVPSYTTSLDAALEGEAIEFAVKSDKRERWGAMHRSSHRQEFLAWAATEPLARRLAALKGRRADLLIERDRERLEAEKAALEPPPKTADPFTAKPAEPVEDAAPVEDETETEQQDWKVLF